MKPTTTTTAAASPSQASHQRVHGNGINSIPMPPPAQQGASSNGNGDDATGKKGHAAAAAELATSTLALESRLRDLRDESNRLSHGLTQKLAASEAGRNLLNVGQSLSALPTDVRSLTSTVRPLLDDAEGYVGRCRAELERVTALRADVARESVRSRNAAECVSLYEDLVAGERDVRRDASGRNGKHDEEAYCYLDHVASLERCAHTTLHLLNELEKSTAQLSAMTSSAGAAAQPSQRTSMISIGVGSKHGKTVASPAAAVAATAAAPAATPQDAERAQFLSKLAPRIRRLESDATKCLGRKLDSVLTHMTTRHQRAARTSSTGGGGGDDGRDALLSRFLSKKDLASNRDEAEEEALQQLSDRGEELLAIGHCLRGLALLGKGKEAESVFARVAIMPLIRSKISIGRLDEGGSRGECAGLYTLLDDIAYTVSSTYGPVLRLSESIFGIVSVAKENGDVEKSPPTSSEVETSDHGTPIEVDLVTAGVWIPIATTLMADPTIKMAIFSPGIASILQANYMAIDIFLSELAGRLLGPTAAAPSSDESEEASSTGGLSDLYFTASLGSDAIQSAQSRIFQHETTADFAKKWNLPIYYQLRFRESCSRLNKAIARVQQEGWNAPVFSGTSASQTELRDNLGFEVPLFLELYDILLSLWRPDVILRPLTHRFLRGSVQLLGRMVAFVKDGLEGKIVFGTSSGNDDKSSAAAFENGENRNPYRTNGDTSHRGKSTPQYSWGENADTVATVAWELTVLETCMTHDYLDTIVAAVAPEDIGQRSNVQNTEGELEELRSLLSDTLVEATQDMSPLIVKSWNEVIAGLMTTKCCAPLSAVKGVAATYRMTNRPPPSHSSPFVSTILRPLKEFDEVFESRTPPQVGVDWKKAVIVVVSERYSVAVEELLVTVQRTEEALKNRKARRFAAGGMSDGEKVKLQLLLDYKEFARDVTEVGVDGSSIEGVQKLESLTLEAGNLLSQSLNGRP